MKKGKKILLFWFIAFAVQSFLFAQNIGIGHNVAEGLLDINGDIVLRSADITLADGTTLAVNVESNPYSNYRISGPSADFNVAGISYSPDGKLLSFYNRSGHTMNIIHESAEAETSERIHTGTGYNIAVPDKSSISFTYDGGAQRWVVRSSSAPGPWSISQNRIFTTHTGNTGIGTPYPGYKLTVIGDGYFSGSNANFALEPAQGANYMNTAALQIASPNTDNYPAGIQNNILAINGNQIQSFVRDIDDPTKSDFTRPLVINPLGGSVGIGTNYIPGYAKLEVLTSPESRAIATGDGTVGMVHFLGGAGRSANSHGGYFGTSSNHPLHFYTNSQWAQVTLLQNGNMGIGTTSPTQKLQVQGGLKIAGGIYEPIRTIVEGGTFTVNPEDYNIHIAVPANFGGTIYFNLPNPGEHAGRILNFSANSLPRKTIYNNDDFGLPGTVRFNNCNECPIMVKIYRIEGSRVSGEETTCITLQSDGVAWRLTKHNYFYFRDVF